MEHKFINLFVILTLVFSLAHASLPHRSMIRSSTKNAELEDMEVEEASCEGLGNEECLMRRTLTAHIDYIYTQEHPKHKHD
ncbi:hypothetical protein CDL12_06204 [Handroanthus impetiginosus]|uniref:Phytosulfokine n=1 Tax=Handroanthus impetiginosus TaxID=429701 RepID=A0A2G9HUG5_9LAMI|nr:hypothetical protein CDL12_06204 [Handroanthus impetiginosus]